MPCPSVLKQQQHATIPEWEALLFVYGVLFVPVLFTLLVGFNILAWARARINYVFIFGEGLHHQCFSITNVMYAQN